MAGYLRRGRKYWPTLAADGLLRIGDWVKDELPDLLWPVLVTAELGTTEGIRFVRWQKAVQDDLADYGDRRFIAECLDGRLTSLDRLAAQLPDAKAVVKARAIEWGLLPDSVVSAMASYPERPAEWLTTREFQPPGQGEIDLLVRAVLEVLRDGHREAIVKCLHIWSAAQAGIFRSSAQTIELLKLYPNDPGTRTMADSAIRAMWAAHRELRLHENENYYAAAIQWARIFWGVNSMTTMCIRKRQILSEAEEPEEDGPMTSSKKPGSDPPEPITMPAGGGHLRQLAMDLLSSYVEALETSAARLYDNKKQEVHSGLISRLGREVITVLGAPDFWCMEHGAHVIRALVEVRIYITWMAQQDDSIYEKFQEYGYGKAKLYAKILEELPEDARTPDFTEGIQEIEKLSHDHDVINHRIVDTSDSFADGKSIRKMAEECGLLDLYRQAYSMASGVSHSEWWSIETHAMERCLNVLHGGHLIPSLSLDSGGSVQLASSWVDQLYALIQISLRTLSTDGDAVKTAFAWLDHETESTDSSSV